jgi:hypothetical protein
MTTSSLAFGSGIGHMRGNHTDVPSILMHFGIGRFNSQVAAQYVFMIPRTTDPDAQGVIMLVEAVQRGLLRMGAGVKQSGILDQATVDALRRISGPEWHGKTWLQILGDVSDAIDRRVWLGRSVRPLGEYVSMSGIEISTGAVFVAAIGAYLVVRALRR